MKEIQEAGGAQSHYLQIYTALFYLCVYVRTFFRLRYSSAEKEGKLPIYCSVHTESNTNMRLTTRAI